MDALIIVDIQHDFLPGGALAVENGDEVIPVANRLAKRFSLVVATQDWHPEDHLSFAANHPGKKPGDVVTVEGLEQRLWPVHCVEGTHGAEFPETLDQKRITRVFKKGTEKEYDSYSGFYDNGHRHGTGLGDYLRDEGVDRVIITGLATDYCVLFTALDARKLDFETVVVNDGCRGVDLEPGDVEKAKETMRDAGVELVQSTDVQPRS